MSNLPVAPIAAHQLLVLLLQLGVLLGTAVLLGRVARPLRMPLVVAELAAGVILGPSLLGHVSPALSGWLFPHDAGQLHLLDAVGQFGVLMLVAITGLHVDLDTIRSRAGATSAVGAGALLVPLGLGIGAGFLLPDALLGEHANRTAFALFMGTALGVSAIPVIAKALLEMKLLKRDIGQLIIGAAAIDDVAGWLLLSVVAGVVGGSGHSNPLLWAVAGLIVAVAVTVVLGRPIVRLSLRVGAPAGAPGATTAVVVFLVLLASAGTQALGLEAILGALLCGIVVRAAGVDPKELAGLRTFVMTVLAPIFFATAGLRMDLTSLRHPSVLLAASVVLVVAIAGKIAGGYLGARLVRLGHWKALALGSGLSARGVVEVIVAMVGLRLGVLNTAAYTVIVLIAIVTSLLAPAMLRYAVRRSDQQEAQPVPPKKLVRKETVQ